MAWRLIAQSSHCDYGSGAKSTVSYKLHGALRLEHGIGGFGASKRTVDSRSISDPASRALHALIGKAC